MDTNTVLTNMKGEWSWLQRHERMIIVILVLLAGSWGLQHFLNNQAAAAEARATIAEKALEAQKAVTAQNALQTAQVESQYLAMVDALTKQNASLAASVAARQGVLQQTQTQNKALPLPELGKKMQVLANIGDTDITASTAGITLNQLGAVAVVNTLEQVPVLLADNKDLSTIANNKQAEVDSANGLITTLHTQVDGLNLQITTGDTACKAEIASVKASARKGKLAWFKIGFVTGFLGGVFTGHSL
jgi:flagellar biogenesis protein FliO